MYVCSEDATEVVGTAEVVECYLEDVEDPSIILRGVMFDAERVLSSQVHVLQHDVEYYKQARDAECLKSPDRVPGRTITESDYSDITEWARNFPFRGWEGRTVLAGAGITIVPDSEPTNVDLIERKLRELREEPGEWMTCATDSDICGFARVLDAKGVKAPERETL